MKVETQQTQNWSDACLHAVRATTECADWCIQNNEQGRFNECIRLCIDCGDIGFAASRLIVRESRYGREIINVFARVAEECAEVCGEHEGEDNSLRRCAEACREAAEVCKEVVRKQSG